MSSLPDLIRALVATQTLLGRSMIVSSLRPPASARDLTELQAALGRPLPSSIRALLNVHDGCEVHADEALDPYVLLPAFYWMPWREALSSAADFPDWFDGSLFPVLASAGGDFYASSLDSPTVVYLTAGDPPKPTFDSIEAMFATIDEWYRTRAIVVAADQSVEEVIAESMPILRHHNPQAAKHWT